MVNTGEQYWKKEYEELSEKKMEITHVTEEYYDHGRNRDYAACYSDADDVLFMTQDAVPIDQWLVEQLVKRSGIQNGKIIQIPATVAGATMHCE